MQPQENEAALGRTDILLACSVKMNITYRKSRKKNLWQVNTWPYTHTTTGNEQAKPKRSTCAINHKSICAKLPSIIHFTLNLQMVFFVFLSFSPPRFTLILTLVSVLSTQSEAVWGEVRLHVVVCNILKRFEMPKFQHQPLRWFQHWGNTVKNCHLTIPGCPLWRISTKGKNT